MDIFVTGGTGYIGRPLIVELLRKGHRVRALFRPGSEEELPSGVTGVAGDALDASSFASEIPPTQTLVHLVGTPHPHPGKARQFLDVDLVSIQAAVDAAVAASIRHFIYVSVAQPAPVMRAYIEVRARGEALLRSSGLNATILRPWYVLGPGHRWPYALLPVYALLRRIPATRDTALRLGLVTLADMIAALIRAVDRQPAGIRVVEVPEIESPGA